MPAKNRPEGSIAMSMHSERNTSSHDPSAWEHASGDEASSQAMSLTLGAIVGAALVVVAALAVWAM